MTASPHTVAGTDRLIPDALNALGITPEMRAARWAATPTRRRASTSPKPTDPTHRRARKARRKARRINR